MLLGKILTCDQAFFGREKKNALLQVRKLQYKTCCVSSKTQHGPHERNNTSKVFFSANSCVSFAMQTG